MPADIDLRAVYMQRFGERIERLLKFHQLHAPARITCSEVLLVLKGAFGVYPTEMGQVFASWLHEVSLAEAGICPTCGGESQHELHTCEPCLQKADAEFEKEFPDAD